MHETELKLQVPAHARAAVEAALEQAAQAADPSAAPQRQHLVAAYYDTRDRRLAAAGMALRVRREGRQWVQTIKAGGPNALQRLEHNVPLKASGKQAPEASPALHADSPAGPMLTAALAPRKGETVAPALIELYRTDIWRRTAVRHAPLGPLELAFDEGWISAREHRVAVCELEIELLDGAPQAVIEEARHWVRAHGLWLDSQTKAHRGDHLARQAQPAPVQPAWPTLSRTVSAAHAERAVLATLLDGLLGNASAITSGHGTPGHLHQLRVGLRRLRSLWRLLGDDTRSVSPDTQAAAIALFRALGPLREQDVLRELLTQLESRGMPAIHIDTGQAPAPTEQAAECLRAAPASLLWLDLLQATLHQPAPSAPAPSLADLALPRLQRWQDKSRQQAKRFARLDGPARHALRKRLKRLRDGLAIIAALLPGKTRKSQNKALQNVQHHLGLLNDLHVAEAPLRALAQDHPPAWFALGWAGPRQEQALKDAAQALQQWRKAARLPSRKGSPRKRRK